MDSPALKSLLVLAALAGAAAASAQSAPTPVVVELFTSEGCSDCPPADAVLSRLVTKQPVAGVRVIALEEHVDYWNALGWRDPYSQAQFTRRQRGYAAAFDAATVYTPQMVVAGETDFVGSNGVKARRVIAAAAEQPRAMVTLNRVPQTAGSDPNDTVRLAIRVGRLPEALRGQPADVWLAVIENGLSSRVTRGENGGRLLHHDAVVRRLRAVARIEPGGETANTTVPVSLEGGWNRDHLAAVAFVQLRGSRRIVGAAAATPFTRHH